MPIYDATFAGGSGVHDLPVNGIGSAGLWLDRSGSAWSVSGSTLVGVPSGSQPAFLTRPSAEPYQIGTSGGARGVLQPAWGSSQAIIGLPPRGGIGSSAVGWGLALNWSMPGTDTTQSVYYLCEARPSTVSDRPSTLTITRVDGGTSTTLGSVSWVNDTSKDYDFVFESWCEYLGRPVFLRGSAIDRAIPTPNIHDSLHDLTIGPAGVAGLAVQDAAPGLSNNLQGCPALVALPGTAGATFSRVRLYGDAPSRTFSGFGGSRVIGQGYYIATDGTITPYPATPGANPGGLVLPL